MFALALVFEALTLIGAPVSSVFDLSAWGKKRILVFGRYSLCCMPCSGILVASVRSGPGRYGYRRAGKRFLERSCVFLRICDNRIFWRRGGLLCFPHRVVSLSGLPRAFSLSSLPVACFWFLRTEEAWARIRNEFSFLLVFAWAFSLPFLLPFNRLSRLMINPL